MPAKHLATMLEALSREAMPDMSEDFMASVWERTGTMAERRERHMRLAIFVGLFAVGLGAGASTVQAPAYAQETTYLIADNTGLTPAALLHVDR